jgi:hypothetical protein
MELYEKKIRHNYQSLLKKTRDVKVATDYYKADVGIMAGLAIAWAYFKDISLDEAKEDLTLQKKSN